MGTTLWTVEVRYLRGADLVADVERMHEDAGRFPRDPVFALRLLHEQVVEMDVRGRFSPVGPLGEAVSEVDIYDDAWLRAHATEYVRAVTVEPPQDADAIGAVARYVIAATSPRWLEHLQAGQRWRSAAFS